MRVKHNNRDNESCFTTIYDERGNTATLCSVPAHHERNRAEAKRQLHSSSNSQQKRHRNYYASNSGEVISESYSVEEIHVDDEGDAFRKKYQKLGGLNRIMVIIDNEYYVTCGIGDNNRINNKVMEIRTLCKQQEESWAARTRQLARKTEDIAAAQQNIGNNRLKNKAYFDKNHHERVDKIGVRDMVLLYNSSLEKQWLQKLKNRWQGPYRSREIAKDRGT